jgi:hypothetical protein
MTLSAWRLSLRTLAPLPHGGIQMTVRYSHLVPEHKAQAVMRLAERFKQNSDSAIVSPELKQAIGEVQRMDLAQTSTFTLSGKAED